MCVVVERMESIIRSLGHRILFVGIIAEKGTCSSLFIKLMKQIIHHFNFVQDRYYYYYHSARVNYKSFHVQLLPTDDIGCRTFTD